MFCYNKMIAAFIVSIVSIFIVVGTATAIYVQNKQQAKSYDEKIKDISSKTNNAQEYEYEKNKDQEVSLDKLKTDFSQYDRTSKKLDGDLQFLKKNQQQQLSAFESNISKLQTSTAHDISDLKDMNKIQNMNIDGMYATLNQTNKNMQGLNDQVTIMNGQVVNIRVMQESQIKKLEEERIQGKNIVRGNTMVVAGENNNSTMDNLGKIWASDSVRAKNLLAVGDNNNVTMSKDGNINAGGLLDAQNVQGRDHVKAGDGAAFMRKDGYIEGQNIKSRDSITSGKITTSTGIDITNNDPGALVEKKYGNNVADRYGIGQYPNGAARVYGAGNQALATVGLGFANGKGGIDDVMIINRNKDSWHAGNLEAQNIKSRESVNASGLLEGQNIRSRDNITSRTYTSIGNADEWNWIKAQKSDGDLYFGGDKNNRGIWSNGDRPVSIYTGNTERLRADKDGNIDIQGLRLSQVWANTPGKDANKSEISNDTTTEKKLMIVGNRSAGGERRVGILDTLDVNGKLNVTGKLFVNGKDISGQYGDNGIAAANLWATNSICIDGVCINKDQLLKIKQATGG